MSQAGVFSSVPTKLTVILALFIAGAMGACTYWVLVESDLFMFMRLGRDLLSSGHISRSDHWSSTATGQDWPTYQWLTAVVFEKVARLHSGYGWLSALRALLAAIPFLFLIPSLLRQKSKTNGLIAFTLLALPLHVIFGDRLFLRAEILSFSLCFVPMVALWSFRAPLSRRLSLSLALLVLWSNLHGGTAPFGVFYFLLCLLSVPTDELKGLQKGQLALSGILTWFVTPIGFGVVKATWMNAVSVDWSFMMNNDHFPLLPAMFSISNYGGRFYLWLILTGVGVPVLVRNRRSDRFLSATLFFVLIMTAVSLGRVRARIYPSYVLVLPLLSWISNWIGDSKRRRLVAGIAVVIFGVLPLWHEVLYIDPRFGSSVGEEIFPVGNISFLKEVKPVGRLLNPLDYGGYIEYEAGDSLAVSSDARALPFLQFLEEYYASQKDPESFRAMLERQRFDIVLELFPATRTFDGLGDRDSHQDWFPPQHWALVSFDNASVVYLRRGARNDALISKFEYRTLVRNRLPVSDQTGVESPEKSRAFVSEVGRCLERCPTCVYCLLAQACLLRRSGRDEESRALLGRAKTRASYAHYDFGLVDSKCRK